MSSVALIGAGGHAKVVFDALTLSLPNIEISIYDPIKAEENKTFFGYLVQKNIDKTNIKEKKVHLAFGNNEKREELYKNLEKELLTIYHPKAIISSYSSLDEGCFIAAQAIIAPDTRIGKGVIVNHASVIDHDCIVEDWCHIAPNVTLGGNVSIGKRSMIGAGATILPGITIGHDVIIGAGSVVLRDIEPNTKVVGVPAKLLKNG